MTQQKAFAAKQPPKKYKRKREKRDQKPKSYMIIDIYVPVPSFASAGVPRVGNSFMKALYMEGAPQCTSRSIPKGREEDDDVCVLTLPLCFTRSLCHIGLPTIWGGPTYMSII